MADKTPIRTVYTSGVATGLAEFQTGETVALAHGGLGAALSLGTAGQVIKVNSGASALEFGAVEAIINIDTATDLTSNTLATGDQLMASDGGTEGRVTLAQLDTLFSGTSKTLTNKTLTTPVISSISNTGTITLPTSTDTLVGKATTDTLTNKTLTTPVISSVSNSGTITIPTGTDTLVGKATTDTLTNKTLTSPVFNTGVSGTAVLDSDTMSGASATTLSTSESIKAYVDAQITAEDLDVTSDSGTIDIDLDSETMTIAGGTGIDTSATGTTVTIAGEDASTSNKGIASFATADFSVSSGAVSIKSGGITNTQLANSSITFTDESSTAGSVALGGNIEFLAGEGIDTAVSGRKITITGEDASTSNKGIASFTAADFSVSSGAVSLVAERVQDIIGAMVGSNTETRITVTYQDADGTIDFVVDNDLANYDNSSSGFITASSSTTLTNKTYNADGTGNSLTNVEDANIKAAAAIDATKIADGSVTSAEFQYINTLSSNAQTQLDVKASKAFAIAQAVALG